MQLTIEGLQGAVPVTKLGITGSLDGSNFKELITTAQEKIEQTLQMSGMDVFFETYTDQQTILNSFRAV